MGSKIQTEPEKKKLFNDVEGAASQVGKKKLANYKTISRLIKSPTLHFCTKLCKIDFSLKTSLCNINSFLRPQ